MTRQRHWKNYSSEGETCFVTTTCLDRAHCFTRPEIKDEVVRHLVTNCERQGAGLSAYVVLSNHLHFIVTPDARQRITQFVQIFKRNVSLQVVPILTDSEIALVSSQEGLNMRRLWQRSFRSVVVDSEHLYRQKANYIDFNPVKAGLCSTPEQYRRGSAFAGSHGAFMQDDFLDLATVRSLYEKD